MRNLKPGLHVVFSHRCGIKSCNCAGIVEQTLKLERTKLHFQFFSHLQIVMLSGVAPSRFNGIDRRLNAACSFDLIVHRLQFRQGAAKQYDSWRRLMPVPEIRPRPIPSPAPVTRIMRPQAVHSGEYSCMGISVVYLFSGS